MYIEWLEPRIAPAVVIVNATTATYTDVDGDRVTVRVSKGTLTLANFVTAAAGVGEQLQLIDFSGGGFDNANLTVKVVRAASGDGLAHVGAIDSTGHDLGKVVIAGDLGQIDAADGDSDMGLRRLKVNSLGDYGTATQAAGGSLESEIDGRVGKLLVTGNVRDAVFSVTGGDTARIGSVRIGGSLVGGTGVASGSLFAEAGFGPVVIEGDVIGGSGAFSGSIAKRSLATSGNITSIRIEGSLLGGAGTSSGQVTAIGNIGSVWIGGDVVGGTGADSGNVFGINIGPITLGGSLLGNAEGSGSISAVQLGAVKIAHNVKGGAGENSGSILANGDFKSVAVGGSLLGGAGVRSGGIYNGGDIGPVTIGENVKGGAGADSGKIDSAGNIRSVTIKGSLIGGTGEQGTIPDFNGVLHPSQIFAAGNLGAVKIAHDVRGDAGGGSGSIRANNELTSVSIGGSLIGGSGSGSGWVWGQLRLGDVSVGHDLKGGSGVLSGNTGSAGAISSVVIGGSLIGGSANSAGQILANLGVGSVRIDGDLIGGTAVGTGVVGNAQRVTIGGSLIGGTGDFSGAIVNAGNDLVSVRIAGDLIGASITGTTGTLSNSGYIGSDQRIGSVFIGGSIITGSDASTGGDLVANASIRAGLDLGSLTVKGGLIGNAGSQGLTLVTISARGQANPSATADVAIGTVKIGGRVEFAQILAGYDPNLAGSNADAQIGTVAVGGDWVASSIVAGAVNLGADDAPGGAGANADNVRFGDEHDAKIAEAGDAPQILSRIGKISIGGEVFGTSATSFSAADRFGFVAEEIGLLKINGRNVSLTPGAGNDGRPLGFFTSGVTFDVTAHELSAPILLSTPSLVPAAQLVNARTVVYTDSDGDRVTVKLSRPLLTAANVNSVFRFDVGTVGGPNVEPQQLQLIDLGPLATNGLNVTVSVVRGQGDGLAQIGAIRADTLSLGKISIEGDLSGLRAFSNSANVPAVGSLIVRSLGRYGLDTQPPASATFTPELNLDIAGSIGKLSVQQDIAGTQIAVADSIGTINIGGSLLGAHGTGRITFGGNLGKVKIGEHLQGGVASPSGSIQGNGNITSVTIGGSIIGSTGGGSGRIATAAGSIGNVSIAHNVIGGTNSNDGLIIATERIGSLDIGGSLVGGIGSISGRVFADEIGSVKIGGNLIGGANDRTGHLGAVTFGNLTIGGSMIGGTGTRSGTLTVGDVGTVSVGHDVLGGTGGESGRIFSTGELGSLTIKGSLIGGSGAHNPAPGDFGQVSAGGNIGPVKIGHDASGDAGTGTGSIISGARIGTVNIGGALIGGSGETSGAVFGQLGLGPVKTGGDIIGGNGGSSGLLVTFGSAGPIKVGGSLIGGTALNTGSISNDNRGAAIQIRYDVLGGSGFASGLITGSGFTAVTIGGSMVGGSASTTGVLIGGELGTVSIGGNLIGASITDPQASLDRTGYVEGTRIGSVKVGGSIIAGIDDSGTGELTKNGSVRSRFDIGAVNVKGSLIGNVTPTGITPVVISAVGQLTPSGETDVAIGKVTIGRNVERANIFAGYDPELSTFRDGVQIGTVKVRRDWFASNLVAGIINLGADDAPDGRGPDADNVNFGDEHDTFIGLGSLTNRIAKIIIGGSVIGTAAADDHFGFSSVSIGSFKAGAFVAPLQPGATNDVVQLSLPTGDVTLRER